MSGLQSLMHIPFVKHQGRSLLLYFLEWLMGFTPTYSANYQAIPAGAIFLFRLLPEL